MTKYKQETSLKTCLLFTTRFKHLTSLIQAAIIRLFKRPIHERRGKDMTRTITASEAKTHFFKILKGIRDREDEVVVTKDGQPAAILVSYREFEQLMETLELLSDMKAMKRIYEGKLHLKKGGKLLSHEEVFRFPLPPARG